MLLVEITNYGSGEMIRDDLRGWVVVDFSIIPCKRLFLLRRESSGGLVPYRCRQHLMYAG